MDCRACGVTNLSWHKECGYCGRILQDEDDARERRRRWDELSEETRKEFERDYAKGLEQHRGYVDWLRRNSILHSIAGALIIGFYMNLAILFQSPVSIPIDLVLGAAAGLRLNARRGGGFRGLSYFLVAALLSVTFHTPFINMERFWGGLFLFSAIMIWCVAAMGYYMGIKLDRAHFDRGY